jgi:glycosyltransferase involved in cell wall biosynthesis
VHLVALVHRLDHVCCRYRLSALRPALAACGHTLELRPLPRGWWQRWALFRGLAGATVVLQRRLLPPWQLGVLRNNARRLLFDFDDAVFLRDSYEGRPQQDVRRMRRFAATVRACDAVVAGNAWLADHAARWAGVHRVFLAPTCLDPTGYTPRPHPGDGNELVWIGSHSTLNGLAQAAGMLETLGRRFAGLRLKVICDRFPRFEHLPVRAVAWSAASEAAALASADVGVSWVPDDQWSRGKCGLKVLQYMAAGLPVVANPVGVHREMVRHGETGFFASTEAEWLAAVGRLRADPALRLRMGRAGRRLCESAYSVADAAGVWRELLARLDGVLAAA